ncbi:hypothetical protein [Massilia sp. NR 4-1]|uniref:hypothetical protein n=1 Tax=Massilia sp. NR 4-1 TaxID=1678028 RepID=UPI00067CE68E|nr:hypothetical protein [Massilia sp. NR 4-1]AKU20995.1 hypothetical protein ACZ75_05280 [Massilia sp. NR 4-1]
MSIKKLLSASGIAAAATSISTTALAAPPATVADLANAVSFADVSLAIIAVSGTLITLFVTWKGAKFVIRAVKGG